MFLSRQLLVRNFNTLHLNSNDGVAQILNNYKNISYCSLQRRHTKALPKRFRLKNGHALEFGPQIQKLYTVFYILIDSTMWKYYWLKGFLSIVEP